VAVAETHRSRQLGRELFAAALDYARANGVQEVFLMTDSAAGYFEKNGFQRIDRNEAPAEITGTAQFSGLCPASAVVMKRIIKIKKMLVLCTGNSCRSQIAEGYLRHFAGDQAEVYSAGVETHGVNPRAIAIMKEDGIDISAHTSNNIDEYRDIDFDFVITVCDNARERCPYFPTKAQKFHYNFPDPAKATGTETEIMAEFRSVRDMIKTYSEQFVQEHTGSSVLC